MKKIFLDANLIIDFMDSSARDHASAKECIRIVRKHFGKPLTSPLTVLIANFILGKSVRNKKWHKKQVELTFSAFEITPVLPYYIESAFQTHFTDIEDGIQHQCALHAKSSVIITKDLEDFFDSKIPIVHPSDFVKRYKQL